ncbi:MAG: hypothetical protein A2289_26385 [Deltaproteobacteria bacterium RIFOXYA12_FULL_58_15]|nr:MAG: hypothetical protein A2289_26385 [Deltaproteobacteria bacterium RIFOXYA12_FULL_58_15]
MATELTQFTNDPLIVDMLSAYQQTPYHALDWLANGSMYHYGAALFSYFVDQVYGSGNGALLGAAWRGAMQPGVVHIVDGWAESTTPNEPDLLDSLHQVITDNGGNFDEAFGTFAVYRYFIGSYDDGAHFAHADQWTGAEVRLERRYYPDELPVVGKWAEDPPEHLGSSYIAFDVGALTGPHALRLDFEGDAATRWDVRVLGIGDGAARETPISIDAATVMGSVIVPVAGLMRVVLVATNLGDDSHDPDEYVWPNNSFAYSGGLLECPAPTIEAVTPRVLIAGETTTTTVSGSGFMGGQKLAVTPGGAGIEVTGLVRRDVNTMDVTFAVDANANSGGRDLTIELECGQSVVAPRAIAIEAAGGCRAAPTATAWGLAVLALAVAGCRCRRARR